jgi:cytochrome c2
MITRSSRNRAFMWAAAGLIVAAAGVLLWERSRTPRQAFYIVGEPEKGAALFFGEKQCGICHSVNGSGGRLAPDLSGQRPVKPAVGWLTAVLWNHAPGMYRQMRYGNVSYPHLSTQEMADILAFLYQAASGGRAGDPGAGERIFIDKGCVRCHSIRSVGGRTAPDLSAIAASGSAGAWTRGMWNHAQSMVDSVTKALGRWPQFTGSEMNNLIAYAGAGAPATRTHGHELPGSAERGWQVFQQKCIECHSVRGQGGNVGPELGPEHDLPLGEVEFASVLWNHAPAMLRKVREKGGSLPLLEGAEISDLDAFLASLRYSEPTGSAFVGERVFTERGCAHCHGPAAGGTQTGPRLRAEAGVFTAVSFATALWKHSPRMIDRTEEMGVSWPILQATDIGDLVSFLNSPTHSK